MRKFHRSAVLVAVLAVAVGACGKKEEAKQVAASPAPEEKVLNVYNWSDYIAEDTIKNFEQQTGIKVNYDTYDSNEVLETKLLAGKTGYDVVVPSAYFLERQVKAGVFMTLDKSKLPNLKNMDPEIMKQLALYDPGNEHAVPYMWGTTGIGYNPEKVKAALGTDKIDSWAAVFDPENAKKLKDCGLVMLDSPSDIFDSVLVYLGKDPNGQNADNLKLAQDVMMKIRPYIRYFNSSQYINDLANGEICAAVGWSGDILQAKSRGAEASKPVTVAYTIPKEGALMWFDTMAIPADAPHPGNALKFINYIMEPQVAAAISNYVSYANGNAASVPLLDPAVRDDPSIYPPPEIKAKLHPMLAESQEYSRLSNRAWTTVRTGQ